MIITREGANFFKLQLGNVTIAVNPISKDSKLKGSRFGADISISSINHPDWNGAESVTFGDKNPFIISSPGEYEVGGIFIKGVPSHSSYGGEDLINTIYTFNMDGINLCFLGALDSAELPKEAQEQIDEVDILCVPIGGAGTLGPADAYKLAVQLEPKIIIPTGYSPENLKQFLKEAGEAVKPVDKLTVKKKDLEGKEGEVVVLDSN